MATITTFRQGGYQAAAPAQNKAEQWTNATQASDPTPAGYTAWDANGNVTTTRALTTQESNQLAAQDTANTAATNQASLQLKAQNALNTNATFLGLASPTNAQVVAQVQALTRENNAIIRLLLALVLGDSTQLSSTSGT